MQALLVVSKILEQGRVEALKLIDSEKINQFDISSSDFEKALGIPDVRNIQKNIFLKPFQGEKKAVLIFMQNGATLDAQNSMLKLLEEPPNNTLIILVTNNLLSFIPTILSRVKVIEVKEESKPDSKSNGLKEIDELGGFYLAQNLAKDKAEALIWIEHTIIEARSEMIKNMKTNDQRSIEYQKIIKKLTSSHSDLKNTNANPRLALENLFLNLKPA